MNRQVESKIEKFFETYSTRKYSKGQILILHDENDHHIYHLVSGRVKQYDITYRGDEIILNIFKPPAFFPVALALNKNPSRFIFEAETSVVLHQAPSEEVVDFLSNNPDVLLDLLRRVYIGVDGLLLRMANLMSGTAMRRLMFEIYISYQRFGIKSGINSFTLKISEKELASRAGLSRETVSREIHKLIKSKLVHTTKGELVIPNVKLFEKKLSKTL